MANPWDKDPDAPSAQSAAQGNPWDKDPEVSAGPGRGGTSSPSTAAPALPASPLSRTVGNFVSSFNPAPLIRQVFSDPSGPVSGLGHAVVDPMISQGRTAVRAAKGQGEFSGYTPGQRASEAFGHGVAAMLPVVGPAAANAGDQIGSGDIAGGIGSGAGLVSSVFAPRVIAGAIDSFPRISRAAGNFDTVMNGARNEPINIGPARAITDRALTLADRGSTAPKVVHDFNAATTVQPGAGAPPPVTYEAGRDFASNAGKLSTSEAQSMKGDMGRQVKLLSQALNDANRDAAVRVGLGDQYDAAMKEYRQAQQLKAGLKTGAKAAGYAAGLGYAGNLARKYIFGEP